MEKIRFEKPSWRLALFSAVFLSVFLFLGFWQLDRAKEKELVLERAAEVTDLPGELLRKDLSVSIGEPVRVEGQFDPDTVFLSDNRVLRGKVGYEVVQLFVTPDNYGVLVNRGFIAGNLNRDDLPDVPEVGTMKQTLRGHVYLTELSVPEENISGPNSPWVIQVTKPRRLEQVVGMELFPYVVRLEELHQDALPRHWPLTTMPPERHMGYAVTWFVMAIAIFMAFGFSTVKAFRPKEM